MVITKLMGGLGNQMFCYAAGFRLAARWNTTLKLDLSDYRDGRDERPNGLQSFARAIGIFHFNIRGAAATQEEIEALRDRFVGSSAKSRIVRLARRVYPGLLWRKSHVREKHYRFDPEVMECGDNTYLSGFWQSERYFNDVVSQIRGEFVLKDPTLTDYANSYLADLKGSRGDPIVSLHVRRGDIAYAAEALARSGLVHAKPITLDYIYSAIARFDSRSRFLVFSDSSEDIAWCRKNIRARRLLFSDGHSDIQDFALMSACDHHIIANSTFSWWAAWLNRNPNKQVISPRVWSSNEAKAPLPIDDLIPAGWDTL